MKPDDLIYTKKFCYKLIQTNRLYLAWESQ